MNRTWILFASGCLLGTAALTFAEQQEPKGRPGEEKRKRAQEKKKFDPARLLEQNDANKDGFLQRSELSERMQQRFEQMDLNNDGKLSREELDKMAQRFGQAPAPAGNPDVAPDVLFRLLDANNDGKLSKEELDNAARVLQKLDTNKDGTIDQAELKAYSEKGEQKRAPKKAGRPGEVITPAAKGERQKEALNVGDPAPDFTLPELKGTKELTLSSFRGVKPVVLIFASYT